MKTVAASLPQLAVMAAIVATLAYLPLGLVLSLVLHAFGISFAALLTFGGALGTLPGLMVWWLLAFAAACAYSAWMFPWTDQL